MIGVVVVTHGQLATELVNAAEMIVGDLPQFTAVSIGWHDDVNDAREEIAQAIERVRGEDGVLLLTDMFGGTPSNLGMTFLEKDRLEVITGVNLPMLIKLAASCDVRRTCWRRPGNARARPQRHLGRVGFPARREDRCVEDRRHDVAGRGRREPAGHARARGREVRPPGDAVQARVRVARDAREMDGKSIMGILLLAAARGSTITISADGADEHDAVARAGGAGRSPASARTYAAPDGHRRVARASWPAARSS